MNDQRMTIKQLEVTVGEITMGYVNNDEQGVRGYYGKLDIRPPYQREFIYNEKEQQAVIRTVLNGYPLSSMYWVKRSDDAECPYEVMDGQQRTLSICEYVAGPAQDSELSPDRLCLRGYGIGEAGVVSDHQHRRQAAERAGDQ